MAGPLHPSEIPIPSSAGIAIRQSLPRVKRRPPRPIAGRVFSICWLLLALVVFSGGGGLGLGLLVVGVGVIWMGMWILRFCIWLVLELTNTNPESFGSPAKAIAYWIFEPGVFLVAVGVVALDVPQRIRLSLSSSALEKYVADVQAGTVAEQRYGEPPRRIGLYTVSETELLKDGVVRLITSSDGLDDVGLVFAKNSEPPVIGEDSYSHMTGPWWHWHRSW